MNKTCIADLRQERGWTQEHLAAESGVGLRTVQRIESGSDASLETLSLLANAFRVSVRDLFSAIEDSEMDSRVESLEGRTQQQQSARDRLVGAWRWLYIGVGMVVTVVSFMLSGWGLIVLTTYWGGGFVVLMAIRSLLLEPMLERRFPLSRSKREIMSNRARTSKASVKRRP